VVINLDNYRKVKRIIDSERPYSARNDPVYGWHPYQAKKPPNIVRKCLEIALESFEDLDGKRPIVCDPFAGSGIHGGESLKLGAKVALLDICPLSIEIIKWTLMPVTTDLLADFEKVFKRAVVDPLKPLEEDFYTTSCPICGGKGIGLEYRYDCVNDAEHPADRKWKLKAVKYRCDSCRVKAWKILQGHDLLNPPKDMKTKKVSSLDESGFDDFTGRKVLNWKLIQNTRINVYEDMFVEDLYTGRALRFLTYLTKAMNQINNDTYRDLARAVVSSALHLLRITDYKRQVPQNFYIPKRDAVELNAVRVLVSRLKKFIHSKMASLNRFWSGLTEHQDISHWLARDFSELEEKDSARVFIKLADVREISNHVAFADIIHTDPPYADQVPYLEYYAPYFAWLGLISYNEWLNLMRREIIISDSPVRDKSNIDNYSIDFYTAFKEVSKIMTRGRTVLQLWYACRDEKHWSALMDQLNKLGFERIAQSSIIPRRVHTWKEVISKAQNPQAAVRSSEVLRHYIYLGEEKKPVRPAYEAVPKIFVEYALDCLSRTDSITYQELLYGFILWFLDRFDVPPPKINYLKIIEESGALEIREVEEKVGSTSGKLRLVVPTGRTIARQTFLEEWQS